MALTVDDAYRYILFIMRKNQAGGLKSSDFERAFNSEQSAYLSDLLGRWQNRGNGKSGQNTGLIEDETILTKLAPVTINYGLVITAGKSVKPSDFVYLLSMRISDSAVVYIPKSQLASMMGSVLDPPSETLGAYYYTDYEDYFQFFPSSVTISDLDYIARPREVVWGFTYDTDGRQVYDPGTSVDPVWNAEDVYEICRRCLKQLGVTYKDADAAGYGNSVINTGD